MVQIDRMSIRFQNMVQGGITMRRAIWLPAGEIVLVKYYDPSNNRAIIEHEDGRYDRVSATSIVLLTYPAYELSMN